MEFDGAAVYWLQVEGVKPSTFLQVFNLLDITRLGWQIQLREVINMTLDQGFPHEFYEMEVP